MTYNTEKIVAIIPAYEPPCSFVGYAEELLKIIPRLVVVNDGSGQKYAPIFEKLKSLNGCTVIDYVDNRGKGYALCRAFEYLKQNFNEEYVFVTADCDGQHLISDVLKVCESAFAQPNALHLGSRDFDDPIVPKRSRRGNIITRKLFGFLYGVNLKDTQTGLRAFSYDLLGPLLQVKGERFEYEMNMLVQMQKRGVPIIETPVTTVYEQSLKKSEEIENSKKAEEIENSKKAEEIENSKKNEEVEKVEKVEPEKVSHFRTLQDSARVMGVLFSNLGWYFLSSALSALLDVVAFYLFSKFVFTAAGAALDPLLSTVAARVVSSVLNFTLNYKFVFGGKGKIEIFKYYLVWFWHLVLSYLFAFGLSLAFESDFVITLLKGVLDLCVALISYKIQQKWVFA